MTNFLRALSGAPRRWGSLGAELNDGIETYEDLVGDPYGCLYFREYHPSPDGSIGEHDCTMWGLDMLSAESAQSLVHQALDEIHKFHAPSMATRDRVVGLSLPGSSWDEWVTEGSEFEVRAFREWLHDAVRRARSAA